jgi:Secretion system C-terminal sorting domain
MKPKLTIISLFLFVLLCSTTFSQKSNADNFKPKIENGNVLNASQVFYMNGLTSILEQIWVPTNWEDDARTLFEYNDAGLMLRMSREEYENSEWITGSEILFEYNAQNQLIVDILWYYNEGVIQFGTKWESSYSGDNLTEGIQSSWNVDNEEWELSLKWEYQYSDGLISKILEYDYSISTWDINQEYSYTYNAQGLVIEELTKLWSETENAFENSDITTTSYNSNGNVIEMLSKSWDYVTSNWSEGNYYLYEYEYDNNNNCTLSLTTVAMEYGGFSMLTKSKVESQYDSNNFLIVEIDFTWEDFSSQWAELSKSDFTNDEAGNLLEVLISTKLSGDWENYEKHIYIYDGAVAVENEKQFPTEFALEQNYPNPFNPTTNITYYVNKKSMIELNIYDLLGNHISTLINGVQGQGMHSVNFDGSHLASGTYIYSLKNESQIITRKCLLIK